MRFRDYSRGFWILLAVELIILVVVGYYAVQERHHLTFDAQSLRAANKDVELVEQDGKAQFFYETDQKKSGRSLVRSREFALYPGAYQVQVTYRSDVSDNERESLQDSTAYVVLESEHYQSYFQFEKLYLTDAYRTVTQTVQVTSPKPIEELMFRVVSEDSGRLWVERIEVTEILRYRVVFFVLVLLAFFVVNLLWVKLLEDAEFQHKKVLGILVVLCLFLCLPFTSQEVIKGHDTYFHVNRIMGLATEISNGNWYPLIYTSALNGYGYPNPIFYSQLFLYPSALLYASGFSIGFAYQFYVIMMSVATCLVMYVCARRIFQEEQAALLAAALYSFSVYRLVNVLTRSALGEYTAYVFLPLIVLGIYTLYTEERRYTLRDILPLVIGLSGVILSHLLSAYMCGILIGVFFLLSARKSFRPRRLLALLKAALLTGLLCLFYLLPMLRGMEMDLLLDEAINYPQTHGAFFFQLLNPTAHGSTAGSRVLSMASEMCLSVGLPVILGLIVYAAVLAYRKHLAERLPQEDYRRSNWFFGLTLAMLVLASSYFPYDILLTVSEEWYPLLTVYQFAFRWLTFASLFGTLLIVGVWRILRHTKFLPKVPFCLLVLAAMVLNMGQVYGDKLQNGAPVKLQNHILTYTTQVGAGEYLPLETNVSKLYYRDVSYDPTLVEVSSYESAGTVSRVVLSNVSSVEGYADLPLLYYDGYVAKISESGERLSLSKGDNNRIRVPVPVGFSGEITVSYEISPWYGVAAAVSLLTGAGLVISFYWEARLRTKRLRQNTQAS